MNNINGGFSMSESGLNAVESGLNAGNSGFGMGFKCGDNRDPEGDGSIPEGFYLNDLSNKKGLIVKKIVNDFNEAKELIEKHSYKEDPTVGGFSSPSKLPDVTIETIWGGKDIDSNDIERLDRWILKEVLSSPDIKYYSGERYPYTKYQAIETLLWKYKKDLIEKLSNRCPIKSRKEIEEIAESLAWCIFIHKIDPRSVMPELPEYKSFWDKFSEKGHV